MKRKSRGEQMLLAAGGALPVRAAEAAQRSPSSPQEKPAKQAKTVAGQEGMSSASALGPPSNSAQRNDEISAPKPQELPPDLVLLGNMFDALQTGRMLLKRRGEMVTYSSVRHVVENTTRREFRVSHLAQMKYLRPESFEWQFIYAPSPKDPKVLELQLLLMFDRMAPTDSAGTGSASRHNAAQEQSDFKARLQAYWQEQLAQGAAAPVAQVPVAELPAKPAPPQPGGGGLTPSRSALLSYRQPSPGGGLRPAASCPPGAVPSPSKAFSPLSNGAARPAAVSPLHLQLHHSAGPRGQPPAPSGNATPTRHRGPLALQQASGELEDFGPKEDSAAAGDVPLGLTRNPSHSMQHTAVAGGDAASGGTASGLQGAAGSSSGLAAAQGTPQSKARPPLPLQATPTSHQDARLARLHSLLSPAALQKIQEAEAAQLAQTPEAKRRGEMKRAVQMLPSAYDLVRSIFGAQGPVVKPFMEVVQSMCDRTTTRQGLTARDASNGLVALARAAPEFARIEDPRVMADGSARPRSIIITRGVNINAVGQKLRALAADDDAAVQSLFYGRPAADGAAGEGRPAAGTQAAAASGALAALQPQNLAAALEVGALSQAGSSNGAEEPQGAPAPGGLPKPPRSAKKRPPGLPLPPASPLMVRGRASPSKPSLQQGQLLAPGLLSPSRSHSIMSPPPGRTGPGLPMSPMGPSAFMQRKELGSPPPPSGSRAGDVSSPASSARQALPPVPATLTFERTNATPSKGVRGVTEAAGKGLVSPARTPGRTAVQDALLDSVRRSRGRRHLEDQLLDAVEAPVKRS